MKIKFKQQKTEKADKIIKKKSKINILLLKSLIKTSNFPTKPAIGGIPARLKSTTEKLRDTHKFFRLNPIKSLINKKLSLWKNKTQIQS